MSSHMIKAQNVSLAWLQAVKHILHCGRECSNLIVSIENPLSTEQDTSPTRGNIPHCAYGAPNEGIPSARKRDCEFVTFD